MKVYREIDPEDFEFWGGARDRMSSATEEQRQLVFARIEDVFVDDFASETDINDLVWFECDDIFYSDEEEEEE